MLRNQNRSIQQIMPFKRSKGGRLSCSLRSQLLGSWIMEVVDWAFGPQRVTAAGAQAIRGFIHFNP
jgi:hypothetical protein